MTHYCAIAIGSYIARNAHYVRLGVFELTPCYDLSVGKIGIPDGILRNSVKLDDEECKVIKVHPEAHPGITTKSLMK